MVQDNFSVLYLGKLPRQVEDDDRIEDLHTASEGAAFMLQYIFHN